LADGEASSRQFSPLLFTVAEIRTLFERLLSFTYVISLHITRFTASLKSPSPFQVLESTANNTRLMSWFLA